MLLLLSVAVGLTGHFNWEVGSQHPAHFAVCYFRRLPDTHTIAFESMVKMICLLTYGFSIRVAKMFKGFETSLRQVGAIMRTVSTRRQRGGSQSISEVDPGAGKRWLRLIGAAMKEASTQQRRRGSQDIPQWDPFAIAVSGLIDIHLDLFTSFLAEVYWVIFALIWGTKRLLYTRKRGPKAENEWSFGQTLPPILLLAPMAAIIENLSYSSKPRERERIRQWAINLSNPDWPEFEDKDASRIDREYVASISYHGVLCLAAFGYIQAGVFFVVDDLRGISQPFRSFAF
ncbi:hypothetical protein FCOIX_8408 [Fusarium coicis]|nr:hypothetical protein FCOIX_8408 [Fusarium coicis]